MSTFSASIGFPNNKAKKESKQKYYNVPVGSLGCKLKGLHET